MKEYLVAAMLCVARYGFASTDQEQGAGKPVTISRQEAAVGKALIAKSDCFACHKERDKLVGPSYADISRKYRPTAKNIDSLAGKIVKGGSGAWGQVPMAPHPSIPKKDAEIMVKYILSLANGKE
ncbi:c-type cytochrome [Parapedobacter soli]|uniref:c-type cytochrome n=1 Tax=Parapedobacter soli TaxID=416955 RepID=UPI0021C93A0D|nr:c-type cytochrome [Parapedobacter soli]